ncbi:MAG: hypothetical protein HXS41_06165 [Theionarchaea archaeon]|nr:hypothetical protein [Theionarchaea archaeon]MBU7000340.1 hypothetical protein [Theionarchaea archaeon]MBU7020623.1 hypothetical protein [Theionarchaea archaeon]MBU7035192.1 hypothetical protein [Theionarchaea archaeon]MBU7040438.1 hypothetical protein [Theionarchaea archaeon]
MNSSESKSTERKLTPLGYFISISGMLLALIAYFLLGIDSLFLRLRGVMGLNDVAWMSIGGMIWIFIVMAILTPVVLKWGRRPS